MCADEYRWRSYSRAWISSTTPFLSAEMTAFRRWTIPTLFKRRSVAVMKATSINKMTSCQVLTLCNSWIPRLTWCLSVTNFSHHITSGYQYTLLSLTRRCEHQELINSSDEEYESQTAFFAKHPNTECHDETTECSSEIQRHLHIHHVGKSRA